MGFEPRQAETNGLTVYHLNHTAILSVKGVTELLFCSFFTPFMDKMAEWLRQWTDNPLVSARVGSNPIFVVFLIGSLL